MANEDGLRASAPDDRMQALVSVLGLPFEHTLEQVGDTHALVDGHHRFRDFGCEWMLDVNVMWWWVLVMRSLIETPRLGAAGASGVMGVLVCTQAGRGLPTHGCACHQQHQHRHSAHTGSNAACAEPSPS